MGLVSMLLAIGGRQFSPQRGENPFAVVSTLLAEGFEVDHVAVPQRTGIHRDP